jgi:hypothetical protein
MRITFICISAQQGKDGVGDYTILLAKYLSCIGLQVQVIAFNDKFCKTVNKEVLDIEGKMPVEVIRIPKDISWQKKEPLLVDILAHFRPDVLSLQYVSYGFNKYGVPLRLASRLRKLTSAPWHIMIHEPYIRQENLSLKSRIIGYGQKVANMAT